MNLQTCGIPLQLPHYHPRFPHHSLNNNSIFSPPTHSSNTNRIIKRTTKSPTLKCRHSAEYTEELQQQMLTTRPSPSPSPPQQQQQQDSFSHQQSSPLGGVGASPSRVYVGYSVYKGKAVLTITPKAPEFASLDSGAYKVSREGVALLQFAPAVGTRQYDWTRKQVFSLSVTEIGTLMGLGARDSCEFFHDPNKGKSEEGKVRKILKVEPLPDGSGHFFNLSVQNKLLNVDESIYIPISKAELTVIVSSFSFILPFLLGWHTFADSIKPEESARFNNINSQIGTDVEWNR